MKLVGHRGLPEHFPENTLLSLREALTAGAHAVECDLQFSRDGVPFLLHDLNLKRTSNQSSQISDLYAHELDKVSVHEPLRFSDTFEPTYLSRLEELPELMKSFPKAKVFVEIKSESFSHISKKDCLEKVANLLNEVSHQVVLIAFDTEVLELSKETFRYPIGWVLSDYSEKERQQANMLKPEFLIVDKLKLSDQQPIWAGPWQWFVYDVVDQKEASDLVELGVEWIESWNVSALVTV